MSKKIKKDNGLAEFYKVIFTMNLCFFYGIASLITGVGSIILMNLNNGLSSFIASLAFICMSLYLSFKGAREGCNLICLLK